MASLRRTVEGWMGDILYERLGTEPSIDVAWQSIRDLCGQQLFGGEFVPVPFIELASYFNQLFVFVKKQNFFSTLGLRPPTYKIVGNMDYLVNRDLSTWSPQFDFSHWDVADGNSMYREYKLRIASNQIGVEKSIDFKVIEAHIRSAQPPVPGSLSIHRNLLQELKNAKTLYVITDVVLASYVKMVVKIGRDQAAFIYERDMPIGFKYRKYKLRNNGAFVAELETSLKVLQREAKWLRPLPQPIPMLPVWDIMRRRYNNRKMRNNLTIPTPAEVPDLHIARPRQDTDSLVRIGRPAANGTIMRARDAIHIDNDDRDDVWQNQLFQAMPPIDPENGRRVAPRATVSMETLHGSD